METRGRLSSLDLLPDEAQDDLVWALGELNARQRTQADILFDLNDRLAVKGVEPVSKSAFNRKAVRIARQQKRREEAREIYASLASDLDASKIDEASVVVGEMIKTLIVEMLDADGAQMTSTGAMELAQAYVKAIQGQKMSADLRKQREKEFEAKAATAIEKVAKARGLAADTVADIKAQILGIKKEG